MNRVAITLAISLALAASAPALADDVAAERARLASERIQVEEERRAREDEERRRQTHIAAEPEIPLRGAETVEEMAYPTGPHGETEGHPVTPDVEAAGESVPSDVTEMSRVLDQLRELGALKDAGYVTEDEFERIKEKIIDGAL